MNIVNYLLIFTTTLTTMQSLPVKRQVDDNPDTRPTVSDRYGFLGGSSPGLFNQPFNPNGFGNNIFGSIPFFNQFYPTNPFSSPSNNFISQAPLQNQQFQPQIQQFQPQNQPKQQLQTNRPQNQQNRPQIQQNRPQNQQIQPQTQQNRPQQNQQQQQIVSTTVSPQVQACIDSCIESTAGQYNPVCGSDNQTYHNQERFNCALECGQRLQVSYLGACARPTLPPWQRQQ
ncbi:uncharacterized protein [Chironomus tepperi]|uniref:uncharacterized protein n=1 Tax=Chironomus tepperi TaxID=113505 RepID=UPI00391F1250